MRVNLQHLLANGLELDLTPQGAERLGVGVAAAVDVRGELTLTKQGSHLPGAAAARLELDWLHLVFGTVHLQFSAATELHDARVEMNQSPQGPLALNIETRRLTSPKLSIRVGEIDIVAAVDLFGVAVSVEGSDGSVSAQRAVLQGFRLGMAGMNLLADKLECHELHVAWGSAGFQLSARRVVCAHLDVTLRGTVVRGVALQAARFRIHDADIAISDLQLRRLDARLDLVEARTEVDAPAADMTSDRAREDEQLAADPTEGGGREHYSPQLPVFAPRLLDYVSGTLNVDMGVILKLPLFTRKATHKLRIPVERGVLNYRALERDLSALEDALLDFSLRDEHLVLEVGLPLIPTRGHGKPLVRWELSAAEQRRAREHQVRLATLMHPQLSSNGEKPPSEPPSPSEAKKSPLRELALRNIDARLKLAKPDEPLAALLRSLSVGELWLTGDVVHSAAQPGASVIRATLTQLELELDDFPLNGRRFDLTELHIDSVPGAVVQFLGAKPVQVEIGCEGLRASGVALGRFAVDSDSSRVAERISRSAPRGHSVR